MTLEKCKFGLFRNKHTETAEIAEIRQISLSLRRDHCTVVYDHDAGSRV